MPRRTYQQTVAALLDELAARRQRLYVLQAGGATRAGLQDLKEELRALRAELASAVGGAGATPLS
jgi:hypothetical protein